MTMSKVKNITRQEYIWATLENIKICAVLPDDIKGSDKMLKNPESLERIADSVNDIIYHAVEILAEIKELIPSRPIHDPAITILKRKRITV